MTRADSRFSPPLKSMKRVLAIISVLLALASCSHDKGAMRERMDYVSQCNRADTVFTEAWLPTVDSLVRFFDRHGNANEQMMAHYLQGRVHHDMGEAPIALECYQKATEMADTTRKDCDLHTLAAIYGQMATLFHRQYLPDDEMNALLMAERYLWNSADTLGAIIAYRLRTGVYHLRCDTDSMLLIADRSIELYRRHGRDDLARETLIMPISVCLDRGQYARAWEFMKEYEDSPGFKDGESKHGKGLYNYYKGIFLLSQGKVTLATDLFRKALSCGHFEAGYKGLLSAYDKMRIPDSIAKYAKLYAAANDSIFMHVNQDLVHQVSAMYQFDRIQREARQSAKAEAEAWKWLFITTLALIVLGFLLFYSWRGARGKIRAISKSLFEKNEENERKGRELVKLQAMNEEKELRLKRYSSVGMETEFKEKDVYRRFHERKKGKRLCQELTDDDWEELTATFSKHFVAYYTFIAIEHKLSTNQLRYCLLVRLGFTSQEIGIIMDKDKDQRYHLRKLIYENLFGFPADVKSLEAKLGQHF